MKDLLVQRLLAEGWIARSPEDVDAAGDLDELRDPADPGDKALGWKSTRAAVWFQNATGPVLDTVREPLEVRLY
jgi:hypothetical protein